ncbi:MAG TPA: K+/H+ antiporter subunit F [Casimicrobiaceae bacterium]|jgi:multicomponent K+:H+ antiporter subunit F
MTGFLAGAIAVSLGLYALAMALALWRMLRGPAAQDRVLALDFITVNGMLAMLVLGIRHASTMYFVAALVTALFGFVASTALAKFLLRGEVIE